MPRLGSLLVCEKLILDQQQKPTLIAVFQSLSAIVPEGQGIPAGTVSFIAWTIFTEWFFSDEETKKNITQVVDIVSPDGSPTQGLGGRLTFEQFAKGGQGSRGYVNLFGMPISQPGFVTVNVWLESDGVKITDVFPYQIKIEHTSAPAIPNTGASFMPAFVPANPS
jgi:hypothetical protein